MQNNQRQRPATIGFQGSTGLQENARQAAIAAAKREEAMSKPFRMGLDKGSQSKVIILDYTIERTAQTPGLFYMHEHAFTTTGNWKDTQTEVCCASVESCPVCDGRVTGTAENPYYAMYLSVFELKPFVRKDGTKAQGTRKLLVIKSGQIDDFMNTFRNSGAGNRLRGMCLVLGRGNDNKSPRSGVPIAVNNKVVQGMMDEQTLVQRFGHPERKNQAGKVYAPANADIMPYDFNAIFVQTKSGSYEVDICERHGLAVPGHKTHNDIFSAGAGSTGNAFGDTSIGFDDFGDDGFGLPTQTSAQASNQMQPAQSQPATNADQGFEGSGFGEQDYAEQLAEYQDTIPPQVTPQQVTPPQVTPPQQQQRTRRPPPAQQAAPTQPQNQQPAGGFNEADEWDDQFGDDDIPF